MSTYHQAIQAVPENTPVGPADILAAIKTLRDRINNCPATVLWINAVVFHLDAAGDVIEFPKEGSGLSLDGSHNVVQTK